MTALDVLAAWLLAAAVLAALWAALVGGADFGDEEER